MNPFPQRLLAVAFLVLMAIGLWYLGSHADNQEESPLTAKPASITIADKSSTPSVPTALPPSTPALSGIQGKAALGKAEKASPPVAARPEKKDKYAGREIIAQQESVQTLNGIQQVRRVRLVRDPSFKYPLIRVEDELVRELSGDRLVRQVAMVGDHVMVKPNDPQMQEADLLELLKTEGASIRKKMPASGTWLVAFSQPDLNTVPRLTARINQLKTLIRYAEPDYLVSANAVPNDTSFATLWGMHNTGQSGGVEDADIDAPEAWALATGNHTVKVAVIDSGVELTHPDLLPNLWTNPAEIPGNGVDDDGNGYIDDVRGWDFVNTDAIPQDDNGHGTHCAGTVGAVGNNATGVAGVCWSVSLIALKFLDDEGDGTSSDGVEAIAYATGLGVTVTSNSWSGNEFSQAMKDAIDEANNAGILFVAAAGNNGSFLDYYPEYPACYTSPNIISVTATTQLNTLADFSNHSEVHADIGAPGQDVYSTVRGGGYGYNSGTSMACPHVAGACALLKAHRSELTHQNIRNLILKTAVPIPALTGKTVTGGQLNLHQALIASTDVLISPGDGFIATGALGGPFDPANKVYTISNDTQQPATWTATASQPWITLSPPSGSLSAGETMPLTVTLNAQANDLPQGTHIASFTLVNPGTGRSQTRSIAVQINSMSVYSFDLETDPGWPRTGEWDFGVPLGGGGNSYGSPDPKSGATGSNVFGINLAGDYSIAMGTPQYLTAGPFDLSDYRDIKLSFQRWLNADYQPWTILTIAISTDSEVWNTVWSNSSSSATSQAGWSLVEQEISAFADAQPEVYVRWSHQIASSGAYPYSGWNLDDIKLVGTLRQQMHLTLPASIREGGGPTQAKVTVSPAPPAPLTVTLTSSRPGQELSFPVTVLIPAGEEEVTFDIAPLQDSIADGSQTITLTATAPDYPTTNASLLVHDDEQGSLSLHLPATLQEGSGEVIGQARVQLATVAAANIVIHLESNDATELIVPSTVTLLQGQQSVSFPLTLPEDSIIDGNQTAMVTATVPHWPTAQKSIIVTDNESRQLTVTLPLKRLESAGLRLGEGSVSTAGLLATPLTVSLASQDTTKLVVPATVIIPAGSATANFNLQFQDDSLASGDLPIQVTASASGFTSGSASIIVADDEVPALPTLPSPAHGQNPADPKTSLAWQFDPDSGSIPESYDVYFGTEAQPVELLGTTPVAAWSLPLPRLTATTTYYWKVISKRGTAIRQGPVWSFITPPVGPLHHFSWDATPAAVGLGVPFPVRVTAVDANEVPLARYEKTTPFTAQIDPPDVTTGTGTYPWVYPLATNYHDARTQSIYTPTEAGPAGKLTALALQVHMPPGQALTQFTIRLKHTNKTDYLSSGFGWESEEWTTVYTGDKTFSTLGWTWFNFTTPFDYDGTRNLMVDFSYNNSSYSTDGRTRTSITSNYRTLAFRSDSAYGDPLTWSGSIPDALAYNGLPNLSLQRAPVPVPLTPETSTGYVHSSWSGQVTLLAEGQNIRLKTADPDAPTIYGFSAPINVIAVDAFTLSPEPPFTGGSTNLLSGPPLSDGYEYEIQRATQATFSDAASSGYLTQSQHLFTGLTDGRLYHYRARGRTGGALGAWSPIITSTQDATPPLITPTPATGSYISTASLELTGTSTDATSGVSSVTVQGNAVTTSNGYATWTAAPLALGEGANTFTLTATDNAIPANTRQETWVITRISDPEADLNQNGLSSLLEYAFHSSTAPTLQVLPSLTTAKHAVTGQTHLILSYRRLIHNPSQLIYSVETSTNLDTWQPLEIPAEVLSSTATGDGMTELIQVRLYPALEVQPRQFARLRISP